MRHLSFSRSTRQRLQKLTAFLTTAAMIVGFVPFQALTVMADANQEEFGITFIDAGAMDLESVSVQYKLEADAEWSDAAIDGESSSSSFTVSDETGPLDIKIDFGSNNPIGGYWTSSPDDDLPLPIPEELITPVENSNAFILHYDSEDFLDGNHYLFFELTTYQNIFEINCDGHGGFKVPEGLACSPQGPDNAIYSYSKVLSNATEITVSIVPDSQESGDRLEEIRIPTDDNPDNDIVINDFSSPSNGVSYDESNQTLTLTMPDNESFMGIVLIFTGAGDFDPQSFGVFVEVNEDRLNGVTLEYTVEYRKHGDTDWIQADYGLPDEDPNIANVSGGTITIDSMHTGLKELFFRLPDDWWGEESYPNVDFKITVSCSDTLTLNSVTLGHSGDEGAITPESSGGNIFIFSDIDIFGEIPHDINLSFTNTFDPEEYYGLGLIIPFDESRSLEWDVDGKTVAIPCFDGMITVSSGSEIFLEKWEGDETNPSVIAVWSKSAEFKVEAWPETACTAYLYGEGTREKITDLLEVTVTGLGHVDMSYLNLGFEKTSLNFEGFTTVSPEPPEWEDNNPDKDYTLTSDTYTVSYEGGTVTAELQGDDSTWSGYIITRWDDYDKDYHTVFQIEPSADIELTFEPAEGYEIDPGIVEDWGLDDDNSCIFALGTEMNHFNDPFREEGGNPPDPQGGNKVTFTGVTGMTDTDTDDGIVVINYEHGSVTFTQGDGTMKDGDIFNPVWDSETKTVTIEFNLEASFTIAADPNYDSTCKINNDEQEYQETYSFAPSPNTNVDITFMGPTFVLEVGGELKEGTTYEVDDSGTKITLTYDHGKVEITNFASLVDVIPVTPGGSSVVISYEFTLEGNKADVKFIPDEDYIFSGMHLDRKEVAPDDERINNCVLSLTGIDKNNKVSVEPRFDLTPELKIVKVNAGETIGYDSSTKTLTFSENGINKGTVTITNESDPFSGNPQQDSKITSDITFTITPGTVPESDPEIKYVCFVMLNNGQGIYFPEAGTYTLKASDLRSTPEGNKNELSFEFKTLAADQLAKVKFNGEIKYDSGTHDYYIEYKDGENLIGTVVIPGSAVSNFSANNGETTVTIKQSVASLNLTFAPEAGYTPSLTEYGPEYGENQTVTGEWTRDLSITNNNGEYSYSLTVDPQSFEPIGLRVAFSNTKFLQSTVTYKTYEGEQCAVEIGGTGVPGGDLNNKLVEYQTPLSLTADEDSKEYVKVEDGKAYVRMQFSVPFTYYMSEVKINGKDYSTYLPAGYDELIAAFGNQYTNAVIWVEIADSYVIETKAYKAVFDEDPTKTTLAVGNFLWFYDESHKDNDDYVKNAYLEIVQVEYNGVIYSKDNGNVVLGSAISWDVIEKDGEIVGGEATLPAGSYVTMKLIPDYGTQLVSLGLNGGGFTAHQNEIYTYSFYVGPGNFHLNADFEPVDDVVEASATAVDGGSIALGDGTVDNGTAVLYVGDANVAGAEKTNFENLAADEALEISSYLDISLDKVVYQGVSADEVKYDGDGKNVWTSGLNDLAKPATVTLTLTDDIGDGTVKVLHNHNGNLEVIDADYNPATKELTFETSSFSNYAIAVEAEQYKVTFNANGHGTAPATQTVTSGSKATKPTDPTASGYTFGGWYTDSACTKAYSFDTAVTANITLYAKWTAVTTPAPSTPAPTNTTTPTPTPEPEIVPSAELIPSGTAHVQDVGNVPVSVDPETGIMTIGTTGQGKRLEEITIDFENTTGLSGTMEYRVHVQDKGWLPWTEAGNPAGTEGESKRIEAIEIRLTGELAEYYSVEYCVHIQDYGDMQGWVADGALAGTTGESKRIEQIKVRIVPKGSGDSMSVKYRVHIEDFGWEGSYASGGAMSGTSGQSKRLEAIEIFLTGVQYSGGIKYKTHVQDIGWESSYAQNGEMSGTQGQAKRLEGISIELYGEVAEYYDIYYRVHAQDIGWMGWAKNGEYAGTAGRSARLEGIQIVLVPKGGAAPGATYNGITAATDQAFIEGF